MSDTASHCNPFTLYINNKNNVIRHINVKKITFISFLFSLYYVNVAVYTVKIIKFKQQQKINFPFILKSFSI